MSQSEAPAINVINPYKESDDFEFDNLNPYKIRKAPQTKTDDSSKNNLGSTQKNDNISSTVLLQQGNVVFSGLIMRKCGWVFYEPVLLVLKDNKQICYYDPTTHKIKVF